MRRILHRPLGALLLAIALAAAPLATSKAQEPSPAAPEKPAQTAIELKGKFPTPHSLDADAFAALAHSEIRTKDPHDSSKEVVYGGVSLVEVLKAGGLKFEPGMNAARETVRSSVLVEAADGFQAVFALAELDPSISDRTVLLADRKDGQPFPAGEGPWRLVVPGDKRPARWVRQVTSLTLRRD